ncbi:potassium channel subfamily K member 9-like [Dendronephthya gigantea]|uniref:potassium channel subfamily K member 9-like n=1 Tax=Dendronephthya gigantea TaxID=151771 RepID=UPI00106D94A7|nr:potassium channel subfamily K member 9-like [Dendronephthya gigantea]
MGAKKDLKALFLRLVLVVVYCLIGAAIFYAIEHEDIDDHEVEKEARRKEQLYNETKREIMQKFNISETEYELLKTKIIQANSMKSNNRTTSETEWTFTRGIDLCWQTITTVGYGNKTPSTLAGQLFLIPFALFGIPLTVLMLNTFGQNICHFVCFIIQTIEKKLLGRKKEEACKVKSLLVVSFLSISLLFLMAGISVHFEGWSFGLGLYVWFVTFTTVGFGDFIPGQEPGERDGVAAILYRLIFVVIGLSLISTLFNAMADCVEDKRKKAHSKSWFAFFVSAFDAKKETKNEIEMGVSKAPSTNTTL